jgi:hypothetical protein
MPEWMREFARLAPTLQAALEYAEGTYDLDDVVNGVIEGTFQFWPGERSALVTEVVIYPKKRVLNFFLAAGEGPEVRALREKAERWAKEEQGCTSATLMGRRGWARSFLREEGYRPKLVYMSKEL